MVPVCAAKRFCSFRGLVPLHNACSYGHYEVTELLLKAGANVNAMDLWQFTPLHEAAAKARIEVRLQPSFPHLCLCSIRLKNIAWATVTFDDG